MNLLTITYAPSKINTEKPQLKFPRVFSQQDMIDFTNALNSLSWNDLTFCNNVDIKFDIFWNNFNTRFELHFPSTKLNFNQNKHSIKYFKTAGLLISRKCKLELDQKILNETQSFLKHLQSVQKFF
jgi:hypothetical protein